VTTPDARTGDRPKVLVLARPYDLSETQFDGFVTRHRRLVNTLADAFDVAVLFLRSNVDEELPPTIPGVTSAGALRTPRRRNTRSSILTEALRNAMGRDVSADRELHAAIQTIDPEVVVAFGPWLNIEYRAAFASRPTIYFAEEDLSQLEENASQSRRGQVLRSIETLISSRARHQPAVVVSISRSEVLRARRRFPRAEHVYLPFTLPRAQWPPVETTSEGEKVLAVGNFLEWRNAEGLVTVLEEIAARAIDPGLRIRVVSDAGIHEALLPFLGGPFLEHAFPGGALQGNYRNAFAALVPALRMTGMKTTILQAWSCGCPVVCSSAAAATVDTPTAVASGADGHEMVERLLALREDRDERDRLVRSGISALRSEFDPDRQDALVRQTIMDLAHPQSQR